MIQRKRIIPEIVNPIPSTLNRISVRKVLLKAGLYLCFFLLLITLFIPAISVAAETSIDHCTSTEEKGAIWITASCVDPLYSQPIIDSEVDLMTPIPHRKVSGHFQGTEKRFNFYFPMKNQWEGRFFQIVYPLFDEHATDERIQFGAESGAYTVQTNGGGGYRVDAAAAKFSKIVAAKYYGMSLGKRKNNTSENELFNKSDEIYGYIYGGSGGSLQTIGAIENTNGVWDGAVPYVPVTPTSIPNNFFIRAFASFVLSEKANVIADAVKPGGSGNPYTELNEIERDVLLEVTKLGVPLRTWEDYPYLLGLQQTETDANGAGAGLNAPQGLLNFGSVIRNMDPTYVEDFWSKPGYLGTEQSALGDLVRANKIDLLTGVMKVHRNNKGEPIRLILDIAPEQVTKISPDYTLYSSDGKTKLGTLSGSLNPETKEFTLGSGNNPKLLDDITTGAKLKIDNLWSLALLTYHRHQIPMREGFYV